jgi:peroxiredoxin
MSLRISKMSKIKPGTTIEALNLEPIEGEQVRIPHRAHFTHLQFRRFAGCPMCNLHIQSFINGHQELLANGIQEVAVFHSTKTSMRSKHATAPFPLIADPEKLLYKKFGVEQSILSVLHPRAWVAGVKGLFTPGIGLPDMGESVIGLPADFLIDHAGKVVAVNYGKHAYDQWELEHVIGLARAAQKHL